MMSVSQEQNIPQVQDAVDGFNAQLHEYFNVPEVLEKSARKYNVNNFRSEKKCRAMWKLLTDEYTCHHAEVRENSFHLPSGYYMRLIDGEEEAEYVSIMYMPTFRHGAQNVRFRVETGTWWRIFLVTKDYIISKFFTTDEFCINACQEVPDFLFGKRAFKTIGKCLSKKNLPKTPPPKKITEEDELLEYCMAYVEGEKRGHDIDLMMKTTDLLANGYEQCEECEMPKGCACERCIRCCLRLSSCTIPEADWRDSRRYRQVETELVKKTKKELRNFKKMREERIENRGEAHGWFPSNFSFNHDHNVNFRFQFLDDLAKAFAERNASVPWKDILKNFMFMCAHMYTGKSTTRWLAVTQFLLSLPITGEDLAKLMKRTNGWFAGNAQAANVEGLFVPLFTLLGVVVATLGVGKMPTDKDTMSFIMKLSKIGACIKSLEVVKDYVQPAVETVIDFIRVQFFGYTSTDMNAWKDYEDYCKEIQELNNSGFEERLKTEKELVIKIDDLLIRGDNLMKVLDQLRVPANQRMRFNAAYAWLGRMRNEAAHCSAGKHIPRIPPVVFHILGTTGVGKSEATSLLNARLLTSLGHTDPSDLHTKVYYRDCGQERFDGYNSGVVGVVVDDFGSRVDTEQTPSSDALEAIRMQNSAVWQLPMASLSEKGSTFFRAKYVVWTSNRATFKFKSITNPEAVLRRVTLKFRQKPRPEFATVRKLGAEEVIMLDRAKIALAAKENPKVYADVWLFDLVDAHAEANPGTADDEGMIVLRANLSFDETAKMCEEALAHAQVVGQEKLDHTARYFEECVKARGEAHGCDWFGWFGKSAEDRYEDGRMWEHVFVGDRMRDRIYEGEDVSPPDMFEGFEEYDAMPRFEHLEPFRMSTCFYVRGGVKVRTRFVRAYFRALQAERFASHRTEEEKNELFGKVLGKFSITTGMVRICGEHKETFWSKWFDLREKVQDWFLDGLIAMIDMIPEGWRVPIAAAFETAVIVFLGILIQMLAQVLQKWVKKIACWLLPQLDSTRTMKMELYRKNVQMVKEYVDPPVSMMLTLQRLEDQLQIPEGERLKLPALSLRKMQEFLEEEARAANVEEWETIPNIESHQERTTGAKPKNIESFQERTTGAKPKNIESFQERTQGTRPRNVEGKPQGPAEATNDQNAAEIVYKVKRNIYGVQINNDGDWYFVGNLLFVVGKIAITNKHIWRMIKGREIRLFNMSMRRGMVLTESQTSDMNSSEGTGFHGMKDVVMLEMPRQCLVHADIRKYFQTKEDFARLSQPAGVCVMGYGQDNVIQKRFTDRCQAVDRLDFQLIEGDGKETMVREWYRYGVHSSPGDCGSVVVVFDPSATRKLIGLHMAGYNADGCHGVGVAIHQELLEDLEQKLTIKNAESTLDGTFAFEGTPTERSFGDFVSYGTAAASANSMKSVINEGPVYGMIAEPKTAPAQLKPFWKEGELIDPLEMARKKADTENVPVDERILKQCASHYAQKLLDLKEDDRDDKVLTWEEAIRGTGDPLYNPVKRNTSPGYGWNACGRGKEPWLGSGENYVTDHPELLKKRDEMLERIAEGKRASTIFVDTLKDERRPLQRVQDGKTRLFAAGEMTYCLLFRQYFAGFNAHVMRNCIRAESTVGINPFGLDWTDLANALTKKGPHVVAGDFSNYDGTLNAAILWEVYDVVETFYENATDEERKVRRALWCELVNSVHATVPFNGTKPDKVAYLYQWTHSQPSGNPMTVILNSVYHSIVMRYVYKVCARKYCPEMVGLDNFDRYVSHVNYGDDDVTNVDPKIVSWFNQVTMTEAFATIGMVYTDEAKSGDLVEYRKLTEISFLKRKFYFDDEQKRWRCPHSLDVILEMPMWVKRGANVYELTATVLEEAVHELAQHPREVFEHYMPKFRMARKYVLPYWPECSFLEYDEYAEVDMARIWQPMKMDARDKEEMDAIFE